MNKKPYGEPSVYVLGNVADLTQQVSAKCLGSVDSMDPGSVMTKDVIIPPGGTCPS